MPAPGSANFALTQKSSTDLFVCTPGWMGLGPRVGSQIGKHAHACGQERSSGNPELKTKPGFRMSLMGCACTCSRVTSCPSNVNRLHAASTHLKSTRTCTRHSATVPWSQEQGMQRATLTSLIGSFFLTTELSQPDAGCSIATNNQVLRSSQDFHKCRSVMDS